MDKIIALAIGGTLGTLSRYGVSLLGGKVKVGVFPLGTIAVNLMGCFLFGLVFTLLEAKFTVSHAVKLLLLTGFMGAFTTFSTYMFETVTLHSQREWGILALNFALQNIGGFLLVMAGIALGRTVCSS